VKTVKTIIVDFPIIGLEDDIFVFSPYHFLNNDPTIWLISSHLRVKQVEMWNLHIWRT